MPRPHAPADFVGGVPAGTHVSRVRKNAETENADACIPCQQCGGQCEAVTWQCDKAMRSDCDPVPSSHLRCLHLQARDIGRLAASVLRRSLPLLYPSAASGAAFAAPALAHLPFSDWKPSTTSFSKGAATMSTTYTPLLAVKSPVPSDIDIAQSVEPVHVRLTRSMRHSGARSQDHLRLLPSAAEANCHPLLTPLCLFVCADCQDCRDPGTAGQRV